jgi:S1-C subfamily serine protease/predicted esterase
MSLRYQGMGCFRAAGGFLGGTPLALRGVLLTISLAVVLVSGTRADDPTVASLEEEAMKAAVSRVAPAIVQIETAAGRDIVASRQGDERMRKGTGPTSGLIVSSDGYIISSAFNFADKPSAVFVAVPGKSGRQVAQVVANDHTRMLTLLKIEASGLPVPQAAPKNEIQVGQSVAALGRTWVGADDLPSVSLGIVSAMGRIWGKAIQTDAKISPVNYGGPLIDLRGRVLGILVPASPNAQDETAGVEWYDSGIGFAIPLEDIMRVLPRLKAGHDLGRGLLGFVAKNPDIYGAPPAIGSILPHSRADQAGLKPGDVFTEINGRPVTRQAQVMHELGKLYEGDTISVKVRRGNQLLSFENLKLSGVILSFPQSFLGILPMRDDNQKGVEIRYVFPDSPAAALGLKPQDRLVGIAGASSTKFRPIASRDDFADILGRALPGTPAKLQVQHPDGKIVILDVKLAELPGTIPDKVPAQASKTHALNQPKPPAIPPPGQPGTPAPAPKSSPAKVETGLLQRTGPSGDHHYSLYVPPNYDPNVSHVLIVWLHAAGQGSAQAIASQMDYWKEICPQQHWIVLAPVAQAESGWLASESEPIRQDINEVMSQYTIDPLRTVAMGAANGAQMAYYLGFHLRELIRGVVTVGAFAAADPGDNVHSQRLAFFLAVSGQDPLLAGVNEIKRKLADKKFAIAYRPTDAAGRWDLDQGTFDDLIRWIDSLDRL